LFSKRILRQDIYTYKDFINLPISERSYFDPSLLLIEISPIHQEELLNLLKRHKKQIKPFIEVKSTNTEMQSNELFKKIIEISDSITFIFDGKFTTIGKNSPLNCVYRKAKHLPQVRDMIDYDQIPCINNIIYAITLTRHYGVLIFYFQSTKTFIGTYDECVKEYNKAQISNLILGWWSIFSIIVNPFVILFNFLSKRKLSQSKDSIA
jgi:hypothetical protein